MMCFASSITSLLFVVVVVIVGVVAWYRLLEYYNKIIYNMTDSKKRFNIKVSSNDIEFSTTNQDDDRPPNLSSGIVCFLVYAALFFIRNCVMNFVILMC